MTMDMSEGMEAPKMSPEQAIAVLQKYNIPPEAIQEIYDAAEALMDAGTTEFPAPAPKGNPLDNAINDAKAQVMGGAQPA
jgi:hypothetical protein